MSIPVIPYGKVKLTIKYNLKTSKHFSNNLEVDDTTGVDTITEQGCGPKFSSDPTKTEHCELTDSSDFYTGGQCWCTGDNCNANKVSSKYFTTLDFTNLLRCLGHSKKI